MLLMCCKLPSKLPKGLHVQVNREFLVGASDVILTSYVLRVLSSNSFKAYWHLCIKINMYY